MLSLMPTARSVDGSLGPTARPQVTEHYRQFPLPGIGDLVGSAARGVDQSVFDPRNRAVAFVFGHYIYTLDGGGQP